MKKLLFCLLLSFVLASCAKNEVVTQVSGILDNYSKCKTFEQLMDWVGQDGETVVMENTTYSIYENYYTQPVITIFVDDDMDDNAKEELLNDLMKKLEKGLKDNACIESVYIDHDNTSVTVKLKGFELDGNLPIQ